MLLPDWFSGYRGKNETNSPGWCRVVLLMCGILSASTAFAGQELPDCNRENAVVRAVRRVGPAVVNISTEYEVNYQSPFSGFSMDDFFRDFFDHRFQRRQKLTSLGSGIIIDGEKGYVLTNAHVIVKSGRVKAVLNDGREFTGEVIGADPDSDLAVLRISSDEQLPAVKMGRSEDLFIGETVIAIGNPFGFSHTVTTGVVSAVNRSFKANDRVFQDFIQTDASINPGNSGGPLLNINGELIGINTAIYKNAEGIGFAIPVHKAKKIVSDLIAYGKVKYAWIGLSVQEIDERLASYFDAEHLGGLVVQSVEPGSPAYGSGIRQGDILISIDGAKMLEKADYMASMRQYREGDELAVEILRNRKQKMTNVTARYFPAELAPRLSNQLLGIRVVDTPANAKNDSRIAEERGVTISEVDPQSRLAGMGVRPGDIIRKINENPVSDVESFYSAVVKYRWADSVVILLQRGNRGYYLTVKL